jgi:hypothetical protein
MLLLNVARLPDPAIAEIVPGEEVIVRHNRRFNLGCALWRRIKHLSIDIETRHCLSRPRVARDAGRGSRLTKPPPHSGTRHGHSRRRHPMWSRRRGRLSTFLCPSRAEKNHKQNYRESRMLHFVAFPAQTGRLDGPPAAAIAFRVANIRFDVVPPLSDDDPRVLRQLLVSLIVSRRWCWGYPGLNCVRGIFDFMLPLNVPRLPDPAIADFVAREQIVVRHNRCRNLARARS